MKFKKISLFIISVVSGLSFTSGVYAASGTFGFDGPAKAKLDESVTVALHIGNFSDVGEGIINGEANLSFDSSILRYDSGSCINSPYLYQINTGNNYKIVGVDMTAANGITTKTTLCTFKFTTLKEGKATVTVTNPKLGTRAGKITSNVAPLSIEIGGEEKSNDATLKSLGVTGYTLNPTFSSSHTSYTVNVPSSTTSVTLTGAVNHEGATVTGLGSVILSGNTTSKTVTVTAEDGETKKTYTVNIVKSNTPTPPPSEGSNDATLKSLEVSGYSISPAFKPSTLEYNLSIPNSAKDVIIEAHGNDPKAKVQVTGNTDLKVGLNKVNVKVTAEDGTVKNYVINVTRAEDPSTSTKDGDATLKSLNVSGYTLSPRFNKNTSSYTIKVANNITGLKVSATPNSTKAKVQVSGNTGWQVGVNTITIKVTAENGTVKNYTVNAIRADKAGSDTPNGDDEANKNDNTLKSLNIKSPHSQDQEFDPKVTSYAITIPYEVEKLDLEYVLNNPKAKVTVTGNEDFKVGEAKSVVITVTSEDGSSNYYVLNVTRNAKHSDTKLEDVSLGGGVTMEPKWDPDVTDYVVKVDGKTDKLDFDKIVGDENSKVDVIGNENFKEGHNTVLLKVTDKDGIEKYYKFDVVKDGKGGILGSSLSWGGLLGILGFLILLFLLLLLFLRRKKDKKEQKLSVKEDKGTVIEFKPEFNFGSKNSSDDDVVHGNFNQASEIETSKDEPRAIEANVREVDYEEVDDDEDIPYDPYDATITKNELIDAIHEAMETDDPSKLKMLLDQDELNQRKKAMKQKEENSKRRRSYKYED